MWKRRIKRAFRLTCIISGMLTWGLIGFFTWRKVLTDRTFARWCAEIEVNGVAKLVEGAKKYLEHEHRKSGHYPCTLDGYSRDPRLIYQKTWRPETYFIFIPMDSSGGLEYTPYWNERWSLCLESDRCPAQFYLSECPDNWQPPQRSKQ